MILFCCSTLSRLRCPSNAFKKHVQKLSLLSLLKRLLEIYDMGYLVLKKKITNVLFVDRILPAFSSTWCVVRFSCCTSIFVTLLVWRETGRCRPVRALNKTLLLWTLILALVWIRCLVSYLILGYYGSYKGVIKREAVYKCTNKDHFTCEAKPSKGKMHCPRA